MSMDALATLAAADAEIDATLAAAGRRRWSLDPDGDVARPLAAVLAPHLPSASPQFAEAFAALAAGFARAQLVAFPDNLLWDLDQPLVAWWRDAVRSAEPIATAQRTVGLATELQHMYGRDSVLGFRYTHDFVYGFDWAKWVARAPEGRAGVEPFALAFLEAMRDRAIELVAVIARGGDAKYPALPRATPRNPFPFSREPEAELAILRALAADDRIPVRAWAHDATAAWDQPWATWREQKAAALGFALLHESATA